MRFFALSKVLEIDHGAEIPRWTSSTVTKQVTNRSRAVIQKAKNEESLAVTIGGGRLIADTGQRIEAARTYDNGGC